MNTDAANVAACLTPEQQTQARIDELAAKANRGLLTPAERAEYKTFIDYIDIVAILKAQVQKREETA